MNKHIVRFAAVVGLLGSLLGATGCAYKGELKQGFHRAAPANNKIPLKVEVIDSSSIDAGVFSARNLYYSHSVRIRTHPALKAALAESFRSVYQTVSFAETVDVNNPKEVDLLIMPALEMRERVMTLTVELKSPKNGDLVRRYQSSGNVNVSAPASVHIIGTLNALVAGALSPVVAPSITQILGGKAERELASRLSSCIREIEGQIRNDPFIVRNLKSGDKSSSR